MIVRVWHGWTKPQNAAAYETLLKTEIFHAIEAKGIDGFLGINLLTRSMILDSSVDRLLPSISS